MIFPFSRHVFSKDFFFNRYWNFLIYRETIKKKAFKLLYHSLNISLSQCLFLIAKALKIIIHKQQDLNPFEYDLESLDWLDLLNTLLDGKRCIRQ